MNTRVPSICRCFRVIPNKHRTIHPCASSIQGVRICSFASRSTARAGEFRRRAIQRLREHWLDHGRRQTSTKSERQKGLYQSAIACRTGSWSHEARAPVAAARMGTVGDVPGDRPAPWRAGSSTRPSLLMVLKFTVADGKIVEMEAIADRDRLRQLDLAVPG
jgi:hypothetical protein